MTTRETDSNVCLRTPQRVLVYDVLQSIGDLPAIIADSGFAIEVITESAAALSQFHQRDFPVVLIRTDEQGAGLEFAREAHSAHHTVFIAVTDCAGCESAILSLRAGLRDYIVWPGNADEIIHALQRAFDEVEHARFRDDMLSMLTHDIKIPLSSILGYSALIFDKESGEFNPRAEEFVKIINASGLKILTLIDNFLTTNKIDSGRLHLCLEEIEVGPFLEDLAGTFQAEIDRHKLTLSLDIAIDLPRLEADEGLLFRAVGNLLSNACKFSPPGSQVMISANVHNQQDQPGGITIKVCNEGPGLNPAEIPEIFERFRRGRAQGSIEGSGLGAYVVKSIVEAHGGKVFVESEPNHLTTFSIYLPFKVV